MTEKTTVIVQVDKIDKEVWQALARRNDESLGRFVRRACNKEALSRSKEALSRSKARPS